jgi:hypothetical protein
MTHPLKQMLDDEVPEALEYWLRDDGLQKIDDDLEAGRIDAATHQKRLMAWVAECRKRLDAWKANEGMRCEMLPNTTTNANADTSVQEKDPLAKLLPQKTKSNSRGKSR